MTTSPTAFVEPTIITLTEQVLYQVPTGAKAIGKYMHVYNSGTEPVAVTIYLPKAGGVSGASNEFFHGLIPTRQGKVITNFANRQMESGASIRVSASIDSVANITVNGVEVV